jgi:hypothetical protein
LWTPNFETIVSNLTDAINPVKIVRDRLASWQQSWTEMSHLADEAQLSGVRRNHMIIGAIVAEMVGIKQLVGAFDGADPYTLQKWSTAERVLNGVLGGFTLVTTAVGISAFVSRMTSACGSYHWGSCFTADVLAENPTASQTQVWEVIEPPDVEVQSASSWFGAMTALVTVAFGGGFLLCERRRDRKRVNQLVDDVFSADFMGDLMLPCPLAPPGRGLG